MSVNSILNSTLYSTMTGSTALTNLLSGTTAVYYQQAPDGATLPYVVFSHQAGGPDNLNPSDIRSQIVFVRGFARTPTTANSIDAACSTLLHKQALSVSGYTNFWSARETDVSLVESTPDSGRIYMAGALYRIRIDS